MLKHSMIYYGIQFFHVTFLQNLFQLKYDLQSNCTTGALFFIIARSKQENKVSITTYIQLTINTRINEKWTEA